MQDFQLRLPPDEAPQASGGRRGYCQRGGEGPLWQKVLCFSDTRSHLLLRFPKQRIHLALEGGKVGFEHAPDDFVSDRGVGMDQAVAKGDDSAGVADPGCKAWVEV